MLNGACAIFDKLSEVTQYFLWTAGSCISFIGVVGSPSTMSIKDSEYTQTTITLYSTCIYYISTIVYVNPQYTGARLYIQGSQVYLARDMCIYHLCVVLYIYTMHGGILD